MRLRLLCLFTFFICKTMLFSQTKVPNPVKSDFSGTLSFLASDWMQGRGAIQKGGFMASDYIASMMELYQLKPFQKTSYFQDFKIIEHTVKSSSLAIEINKETIPLSSKTDYVLQPVGQSLDKKASILFVGYGLNLKEYNEYKNQDVKDKVVLVLKGFPGHNDSTSINYKRYKKRFPEESNLEEIKLQTAIDKGAIAMIVIDANFKPDSNENELFHSLEKTMINSIPVFTISRSAAEKLLKDTQISLSEIEKKSAQKSTVSSTLLKNKKIAFSIQLASSTFPVRNVIGIIPGKDTTKTIIIGAHYDHLGIKNDSIYNGADDNASGTSGMLALAKKWSESRIKPEYNILFASWTAEEMGLLGSEYFVQNFDLNKEKILLAINMDMISRSAPEDKNRRILSIGTQKGSDSLKEIANEANAKLNNPFSLDLWETDGHSGSDYASFTAKNIPIMTFFSGFHDDYHTSRDVASKVDLNKIEDVLSIVNNSVLQFLETPLNQKN